MLNQADSSSPQCSQPTKTLTRLPLRILQAETPPQGIGDSCFQQSVARQEASQALSCALRVRLEHGMWRLRQHEVLGVREPRLHCFETLSKIWLCIDPAHVQHRLGNL